MSDIDTTTEEEGIEAPAGEALPEADPEPTNPDVGEASSTSEGESIEKDDLLKVVKSGLKEQTDPAPEQPADAEDPPPSEAEDGDVPDTLDDMFSETEIRRFKTRTQERIRDLVRRVKEAEPQAHAAKQLNQILQQNQITNENFISGLNVMAIMGRGDFEGFLTAIQPYVDTARQMLGRELPPDLQTAVDEGRVEEDIAANYARERFARAQAEYAAGSTRQQSQAQNAQIQQQAVLTHAQQMSRAADTWVRQTARTDPDFGALQGAVATNIKAMHHDIQSRGELHRLPRTPEDVAKLCNDALTAAKTQARAFAGNRNVRPTVNRPGARPTSGARPEPQSALEAVQEALANLRREGARRNP